jgi:hypothetical protein
MKVVMVICDKSEIRSTKSVFTTFRRDTSETNFKLLDSRLRGNDKI